MVGLKKVGEEDRYPYLSWRTTGHLVWGNPLWDYRRSRPAFVSLIENIVRLWWRWQVMIVISQSISQSKSCEECMSVSRRSLAVIDSNRTCGWCPAKYPRAASMAIRCGECSGPKKARIDMRSVFERGLSWQRFWRRRRFWRRWKRWGRRCWWLWLWSAFSASSFDRSSTLQFKTSERLSICFFSNSLSAFDNVADLLLFCDDDDKWDKHANMMQLTSWLSSLAHHPYLHRGANQVFHLISLICYCGIMMVMMVIIMMKIKMMMMELMM